MRNRALRHQPCLSEDLVHPSACLVAEGVETVLRHEQHHLGALPCGAFGVFEESEKHLAALCSTAASAG